MRAVRTGAALIGGVLAGARARSVTAFESVSIERNTSGDALDSGVMPQSGGRLTARNVTLHQLIDVVYRQSIVQALPEQLG